MGRKTDLWSCKSEVCFPLLDMSAGFFERAAFNPIHFVKN